VELLVLDLRKNRAIEIVGLGPRQRVPKRDNVLVNRREHDE
jgi:hypothetical protein